MSATKLRELVQAEHGQHDYIAGGDFDCACPACLARRHLEKRAPALARLVLELSEALNNAAVSWHSEHESSTRLRRYQDCEHWEVCRNATKVLAAMEELEL